MNYDPKLKEAMAKIKAIAEEYDIAAFIILQSEDFAEFNIRFPEWSAISHKGEELRVTAYRKDFTSKEDQDRAVENAAKLLGSYKKMCTKMIEASDYLLDQIEQITGIYPVDYPINPHKVN